jgi:RNA polymerase sigma factor (sigma-70 family)
MSAPNLSDEELAKQFVAGSTGAFETLVQRYSKPIFNFALNFIGDPDEADEAAQLVFVQMYQSLPRARLDMPLKPWIYQIARNKCIDLWRGHNTLSLTARDDPGAEGEEGLELDPPDPTPLPDELAERRDLQRVLRQTINSLPVKYRTAAALRYVNELSFAEIAGVMGVPENTAKTYFQRAKKLLRRRLNELL